jgi:hypothetical protein
MRIPMMDAGPAAKFIGTRGTGRRSPPSNSRSTTGDQGAGMIGKRTSHCCAGIISRGAVMTRSNASDVQCEALFASSLQATDAISPEVATTEIRRTIQRLGPEGCASRMAQEFGDHPEEARDRMRWARRVTDGLSASAWSRPARPAHPRTAARSAAHR